MARLTQLQRLNSKWEFVINESNQEKLELMMGCEVHSLIYADCVYIDREGQVIGSEDRITDWDADFGGSQMTGRVIDTLNTNDKISKLWEEYFVGEMGDNWAMSI